MPTVDWCNSPVYGMRTLGSHHRFVRVRTTKVWSKPAAIAVFVSWAPSCNPPERVAGLAVDGTVLAWYDSDL